MRISLNWLREFVDIGDDLSPTQLAEKLDMAGFEVESVEDRRTWADGVVVGLPRSRTRKRNKNYQLPTTLTSFCPCEICPR
ncbi:MAG: hypothetical protein WCO45_17835 [Pseudanabaena sp. ELA607]